MQATNFSLNVLDGGIKKPVNLDIKCEIKLYFILQKWIGWARTLNDALITWIAKRQTNLETKIVLIITKQFNK